ncbi:hypothetical protein DFH07DRAFT_1066643 [Mycena maculata]|uniref:Uncharacterized protein n=1 Tax=Mycena maculata TaxID=230809 RepID=A0AAD7MPB2_9AGAR|nr:hypothetical protein DFH07DRAFT_1066643 [Mycena maculata]
MADLELAAANNFDKNCHLCRTLIDNHSESTARCQTGDMVPPKRGVRRRRRPSHEMRLPQELVDAIIGEIHPYKPKADPFVLCPNVPLLQTLKSCALVSRACARTAQKQLFSAIALRDHHGVNTYQKFLLLMRRWPHISGSAGYVRPQISSYVRHLYVDFNEDDANLLSKILHLLPNVEELRFGIRDGAGTAGNWQWNVYPTPLKEAFLAVLSRPVLRRICMKGIFFTDAGELDALLGNAVGLKDLHLESIWCDSPDSHAPGPHTPAIVLNSLKLVFPSYRSVNRILSALTTVDLTCLRSLDLNLIHTDAKRLLRATTATLQKLTLHLRRDSSRLLGLDDADTFAGAHQLTSIQLMCEDLLLVTNALSILGKHAPPALRTLSVELRVHENNADYMPIWSRLDAALAAFILETLQVRIYLPTHDRIQGLRPHAALTKWMPQSAQKGVLLHLSSHGAKRQHVRQCDLLPPLVVPVIARFSLPQKQSSPLLNFGERATSFFGDFDPRRRGRFPALSPTPDHVCPPPPGTQCPPPSRPKSILHFIGSLSLAFSLGANTPVQTRTCGPQRLEHPRPTSAPIPNDGRGTSDGRAPNAVGADTSAGAGAGRPTFCRESQSQKTTHLLSLSYVRSSSIRDASVSRHDRTAARLGNVLEIAQTAGCEHAEHRMVTRPGARPLYN